MSMIDETHDPARTSWVVSANGHPHFPIQNLPLGVFSVDGGERRIGVAIGESILDLKAENVRITSYDTAMGAAAAAQRALADGNKLILGPLLAEDARVVAPIARNAGVPVLSFSNDTSVAGNGTYLMGYAPAQSIERVVEHARRSGVTEFAAPAKSDLYRKTGDGTRSYAVRLDHILEDGDLTTNFKVAPGDVITVPERTL